MPSNTHHQSIPTLLLITICLSSLQLCSSAVVSEVPGLYLGTHNVDLDRITLWDTNSTPHRELTIGYTFYQAFRTVLPNAYSSALGVNNFVFPSYSPLSYSASLYANTTSMRVIMHPQGSFYAINYIAFSVVVITETTDNIELIERSFSYVTTNSAYSYLLNSSKFQIGLSDEPIQQLFIQYIFTPDLFPTYDANYFFTMRI